ncbi:hypothetical protein [Pontivivens ytuae]|uniref:Uncharacterized protein n=1 Tax=Pontivivens ytuae TaxID=2789856 RepID=A0A7S9LUP1_9RHOB|nr:hypothetical protein [Pontivivens ytuae]QPH55667.1 hypothetical protein I0K15_08050 [Pontivivens ytuae]
MSDPVIRITARDSALVDTTAVIGLQRSVGTARCQELVEDAIYEITERLSRLERTMREPNHGEALDIARSLIGLTNRLGLLRMSVVASDLVEVVSTGDDIAAQAVAARLVRLGEESLFSLVRLGGDGI